MSRIFKILQTCRQQAQMLGISDVDILEDRHVVIFARTQANLQILDQPVRREEIEQFVSCYWDEEAKKRYERDGSVTVTDGQKSAGELRIYLGHINNTLHLVVRLLPEGYGKRLRDQEAREERKLTRAKRAVV